MDKEQTFYLRHLEVFARSLGDFERADSIRERCDLIEKTGDDTFAKQWAFHKGIKHALHGGEILLVANLDLNG